MNLSKHAAYFMASRFRSLECCTHNSQRSVKILSGSWISPGRFRHLKRLEKLMAGRPTLDPRACLPQRRSREELGWCHVSPGVRAGGTKSRPQKVPGLCSGPPLSTKRAETCPLNILDLITLSWKAKEVPDFNISNFPSSTKVWGKSFLHLENHGGFTFLNKTEKKASTEN